MMDLHIVWVKDVSRWIDSIWINEGSAIERMDAIRSSAESCGSKIYVWKQVGVLQDGGLVEPSKEHESGNESC